MTTLIRTFQEQHTAIIKALIEHLEISLIALLIAAVIAIPLAIILMRHQKIAEVVLQLTSILQTIPSLALLGLLIPFVGIGTTPAIIALVAYAIMPIFQNTYSGLTSIDPSLEEAADAFGLSRLKKLQRLELPIALPMIISGLRISLVMIIGTATLAALIGAGGLGTYILLGIENNNNALLTIGAVLSAALALIFSGLIKLMERLSLKQTGIVLTIIAVMAGGIGVYNIAKLEPKEIVIAGKMGSEPEILINMYKALIEDQDKNVKVTVKPNFGTTTFLYKALNNNQIDVYPEFTGTVLQAFAKQKTISHDPQTAYEDAAKFLKKADQSTYLKPMTYQNGYAVAVAPAFAKKYHLKSISDLAHVGQYVKAGFDTDFYHQEDGYVGLKKAYNLDFADIKTMQQSLLYKAIANDQVNVIDGYTTDPNLQKYHLVVLKDDRNFFPPYQGAALISAQALKKYPELKSILGKLSGKITTEEMRAMNYQVAVEHKKAATVAHNFLVKEKLLN